MTVLPDLEHLLARRAEETTLGLWHSALCKAPTSSTIPTVKLLRVDANMQPKNSYDYNFGDVLAQTGSGEYITCLSVVRVRHPRYPMIDQETYGMDPSLAGVATGDHGTEGTFRSEAMQMFLGLNVQFAMPRSDGMCQLLAAMIVGFDA